MNEGALEAALGHIARELEHRGCPFAVVGALAVSIRGEVRFTRDVDLAIAVDSDAAVESLVRDLTVAGYSAVAVVEHEAQKRLSTVRLRAPSGVVVDLLAASSGIEREVVERAVDVAIEGAGRMRVARAEELVALKVLLMTDRRPQDAIDAASLLLANPDIDLAEVRALLGLISERGYSRSQDLGAKLDALLACPT